MRKSFVWLAAAVLSLGLLGLAACGNATSSGGSGASASASASAAAAPVKVVCENGVMLGRSADGVTSFKGVPYAKPPVDELRWKAPQAPEPSSEEVECYDFGYTALQYEWPTEKASYFPKSAVHAVELPYVFNNLGDNDCAGQVDPATAARVQESWVNFAKTGDPSIAGVTWKAYNTDTRDTMVIEKDAWECVPDPSKVARELLEKAYGDEPYHVW